MSILGLFIGYLILGIVAMCFTSWLLKNNVPEEYKMKVRDYNNLTFFGRVLYRLTYIVLWPRFLFGDITYIVELKKLRNKGR